MEESRFRWRRIRHPFSASLARETARAVPRFGPALISDAERDMHTRRHHGHVPGLVIEEGVRLKCSQAPRFLQSTRVYIESPRSQCRYQSMFLRAATMVVRLFKSLFRHSFVSLVNIVLVVYTFHQDTNLGEYFCSLDRNNCSGHLCKRPAFAVPKAPRRQAFGTINEPVA